MEKVLVYENNQVSEYLINFDQEYMNILLEEYRKSFSFLRKGTIITAGSCCKDVVKERIHYYNDVVSFGVSSLETEGCYEIDYIGAINPVAYGILKNNNGNFDINYRKIHALLHWAEAVEYSGDKEKREKPSFAPVNEFLGLDEKENVVQNISELLEDVSLEYVGTKDEVNDKDLEEAKIGARFIERFSISRIKGKELKKC